MLKQTLVKLQEKIMKTSGFISSTLIATSCGLFVLATMKGADAANITYEFNRSFTNTLPGPSQGVGSAIGTITTNGTLGNVIIPGVENFDFFTDWNITLTADSVSATLTPSNSSWLGRGLIVANHNELTLSLIPVEPGINDAVFQLTQAIGGQQINVYSWGFVPQNIQPISEQVFVFGETVANPSAPSSYTLSATTPPASVPEPSIGIAFLVIGGSVLKRRPKS
ncbi:PEP-CTERM sorting domain-containing protein [Funiculus sociatus GB2-A5]|uniref:PEP-CTERM sorting domain-containing protein n=1 Tax=Funiculus sociatus GB2-A5 TaxID=2933946 RepID=A0ABV0JWE9_9CYAN|nr:PEP-CTERM sorting domain-containing protein [Trichocoleus sp. FACHB-6]MBD2060672.1 PEP-CTERM sorting domain-containing protein [Trichocoleus sp. FACHB-6]